MRFVERNIDMELISIKHAKKIQEIISHKQIDGNIKLNMSEMNLKIIANSNSKATSYTKYSPNMSIIYLMNYGSSFVMSLNNKDYEMFFQIGGWGNDARICNMHLCLGTYPTIFGSAYFSQIELSQALEDEKYIYIVKNITKLAGSGAISRINFGAKTREQKKARRNQLIEKLNSSIIDYNDSEWLVINKISVADLSDNSKSRAILTRLLKSIIIYAMHIENIIRSDSYQIEL